MVEHAKLSKIVEFLFLTIAVMFIKAIGLQWLSVLACLIRTDFNFPFAFFCYYLWISRDDKSNSLMLMVLNGILIVVDLIWLLSVGSIWSSTEKNNPVWGHLHHLHAFVIFISVVNLILKVGAVVAIHLYKAEQTDVGAQLQQQPLQGSMQPAHQIDNSYNRGGFQQY